VQALNSPAGRVALLVGLVLFGCGPRPIVPSGAGPRDVVAATRSGAPLAPVSQFDPDQWIAIAPPDRASPLGRCAGFAETTWSVERIGGRVLVSNALPFQPDPAPPGVHEPSLFEHTIRLALRVEGGWFLGYNAGEFGGSLWFFTDGAHDGRVLFGRNIAGFVRAPFGLFAAYGLEHGAINSGGLLRLARDARGTWTAQPFAEFDGAPTAWKSESVASLLVLTSNGLVHVDRSGQADFRHRAEWIYPSTLALEPETGRVFIGMRYAVVRLTPSAGGYLEHWLVPARCDDARFDESKLRCHCRDADG
jgi:hypothetical protein